MSALPWLIEGALRVSLVVAAALAAVAVLGRRSAALRHWILAIAIASAAATPLVSPLVPAWGVPLPARMGGLLRSETSAARPSATAARLPSPGSRVQRHAAAAAPGAADTPRVAAAWIARIWIAGAAMGLLTLAAGLGRLSWIAYRARRVDDGPWAQAARALSREYGLRRPVALLQSDHPALLVTWGCLRPKVLLPRGADAWSSDRIRVVLAHELAHVERLDWPVQMLAQAVRAVYWINPLLWIACRRLRHESEQATDDAVIGRGVAGQEYATHLVDLARTLARGGTWLPAAAVASPTSLERRIHAMLNDRTNRAPATRRARVAVTVACVALAVAVAAAQATFAKFSGTVLDPTNAFLPGVTMVLTNTQSQAKYEIKSDRSGRFEFVGLPAGQYALTTELPGFMAMSGTLDINGRDVQRDVTLKVGTLQETITIVAPRPGETDARAGGVQRGSMPAKFSESKACENPPPPGGMGGNLRQPVKLADSRPRYPANLAGERMEGRVELEARIGTDGTVQDIQTVLATHPDFDLAAREAIARWEFSQILLNCVPVEVMMKVHVSFRTQ